MVRLFPSHCRSRTAAAVALPAAASVATCVCALPQPVRNNAKSAQVSNVFGIRVSIENHAARTPPVGSWRTHRGGQISAKRGQSFTGTDSRVYDRVSTTKALAKICPDGLVGAATLKPRHPQQAPDDLKSSESEHDGSGRFPKPAHADKNEQESYRRRDGTCADPPPGLGAPSFHDDAFPPATVRVASPIGHAVSIGVHPGQVKRCYGSGAVSAGQSRAMG
jgi:hypothetical protein